MKNLGGDGLIGSIGIGAVPAKQEFSVRYCMTPFSCMTLLPVAPGAASFLLFAACANNASL